MKKYAFLGNERLHKAVSDRLSQAGYVRVDDVAQAEIVLTYCTVQSKLEDLYFDSNGILQQIAKGTLAIDLSPTTPSFARELNALAAVSDLRFVEAPISVLPAGDDDALSSGKGVVCFAAGSEEVVEAARPLLSCIAETVTATGGNGSAQLMRAALTIQNAAQMVAAVESDALVKAFARSIDAVSDISADLSAAASEQAKNVLAAVAEQRFKSSYTVEMLMAELVAALTAAEEVDVVIPQAESALRMLELLAMVGGVDLSPAALALMYSDEKTGVENGLDWSRVRQTSDASDFEASEEEFGHACTCGHHHDSDGLDDFDDDDSPFASRDRALYDEWDVEYDEWN